jgi:type VI secretion system protein ImpK
MERAATAPAKTAEHIEPQAGQDRLALLYQGFLIAVLRVQGGRERIVDSENFRRRMKAALQEVERSATSLNYDFQDIQDTHLAVVAFLDEVVLASEDPARQVWVRLPFAHELLGQPAAGEVFFERLDGLLRTRTDSSKLSDVLEVYLFCLVLGFEGKYAGELKAELHAVMERTRSRIERIRQQRGKRLSPEAELPDEVQPEIVKTTDTHALTIAAVSAIAAVFVLFLIFKAHLIWVGSRVGQALLAN